MKDVVIVAKEVKGNCPAGVKVGDRIVIRGANISLEESDVVCAIAFATMFPVVNIVRSGGDLKKTGWLKKLFSVSILVNPTQREEHCFGR